jgi:AraC-like DNA-binding protein
MTESPRKIIESFIIPPRCVERFLAVRAPYARPLRQRGFICAGISDLFSPYEMGRLNFDEHVVIFNLGGRGWWCTEEAEGEMLPGETWFFPARTPYRYQAATEGWKMAWVHFQEANPGGYLMPPVVTRRPDMDFSAYVNVSELYLQEVFRQDADPAAAAALAELVAIHFDRLLRPPPDARRTAERRRLDELWQEVDGRLGHAWSVTELAKRFCLSPGQFRRVMLEHERITPQQKLTNLRLGRSRELLLGTDYSLARVAALVGYDSPYSFSRAFRRAVGTSPGAFRRRV